MSNKTMLYFVEVLFMQYLIYRYLEFKSVEGSYVYMNQKLFKIPANAKEALSSSLMTFFEKRRFKNMLEAAVVFDKKDPSTHTKVNPNMTMEDVYNTFNLGENIKQVCLFYRVVSI